MRVVTVRTASWGEYKHILLRELNETYFVPGKYLFRGVANDDWGLTASLDRRYKHLGADERLSLLKEMLTAFRREYNFANNELLDESDVALQSLGQHYGLPTRLLDWSESPYIAAYFAFEDSLLTSNHADRVAVWCLARDNAAWSGDFGCSAEAGDLRHNTRLRSQLGHFTYLRTPVDSLEQYCDELKITPGPLLWKFTIPAHDRLTALADLALMGISGRSLFPDLSGVVRSAMVNGALVHREDL